MKILKKILVIFTIILITNIFPILINITNVEAADVVKLTLQTTPYIDVVLSTSKTTTDLTNFNSNLLNALASRNIDTSKVKITSVNATEMKVNEQGAQKIYDEWKCFTVNGTGETSTDFYISGNRLIRSNTGSARPAKGYYNTQAFSTQDGEFNFEYGIDSTNYGSFSHGEAGFLFRMQDEKNYYAYIMDNHSACGNIAYNYKEALVKVVNGTYSVVQTSDFPSFSAGMKEKIKIVLKGSSIKIYRNNKLIFDYNDSTYTKGAYGFYVWDQYGAYFGNINATMESVKTFEEVLREPEWRENSIKVLVNVSDVESEQLNNPESLGELLTRMINDEIHFVGWGKSVNKTQIQNFISSNNGNGTFINNTSFSNSINSTANYIKSLIESNQSSQYVILNENTVLSANNSSIMTNTAYGAYPYGRWKIVHNCEYFENNIGQFADTGKYISNMITSFNKTGSYKIYYEDNSVQPTTIYVHRKPVAEISITRSGNNVTLTSLGYDLDKYSTNKGIQQEEWKYRQVGQTTWTTGKLTNISAGTDYLVQLRVKDYQGTWSAPVSKYITKSGDVLPIASFKIVNQTTSVYEPLEIVDGSYDPYGGTITKKVWTLYKGSTQISQTTNSYITNFNTSGRGVGNYKMSLVVTNNRGMTSEVFTRSFTIIPDDEAPEFTASPTECDWRRSISVSLSFKDRLGSGFKNYSYAITNSQATPSSYTTTRTYQNDTLTISSGGIKYLHIIARDNAGNVSQNRVLGPYKIDVTAPDYMVNQTSTDWSIDSATIRWKFTDSQSGYSYTTLPNNQRSNNIGGEYTVTENGTYTFKAYDKVGNVRTVTKTVSNIDKTPPTGTLSLSSSVLSDKKLVISWTASDTQSGFAKVLLPNATFATTQTGTYEVTKMGIYTFILYDKVGNDKEISIEVNNVDIDNPELIITQTQTKWTSGDVKLDWEAKDRQTGIKEVVLPNAQISNNSTGSLMVTQNGVYTFLAYDKVGNGVIVEHEVTNIDKKAPYINLRSQPDENGNVDIVWEVEDNESGIKTVLLPNGTYTSEKEGKFNIKQNGTFKFIVYDNVGNETLMELAVDTADNKGIMFGLWEDRVTENYSVINWKIYEGQDDYMHILLPDNTYSKDDMGHIEIYQSGTYTFQVYDTSGNETKGSIVVKFEN